MHNTSPNSQISSLDPETRIKDSEFAPLAGVSTKTLRRWRLFGVGPRWQKYGEGRRASVRYRLGDCLAWLASQPYGGCA